MAGEEVTYDAVAAAADKLVDDHRQATLEAVRDALGAGSVAAIHQQLATWRARHAKPAEAAKAQIPEAITAALGDWARKYAEEAGLGARDALAQSESDMEPLLESLRELEAELADVTTARDEALEAVEVGAERIERLNAELRNARLIATDALVGKAKDHLAIEGKDSQLVDLRAQIERNVAASAALSDARLTAEMELIGAVTARDNYAAEVQELRAQLEARPASRGG